MSGQQQTFHFAQNPFHSPNTAFTGHTNLEDNSLHQDQIKFQVKNNEKEGQGKHSQRTALNLTPP